MPCEPMPDGTPRGSCCHAFSPNLSPFLSCSNCMTHEQCLSLIRVNTFGIPPLHDCRQILRDLQEGSSLAFRVRDPITQMSHHLTVANAFHIFNEVLTGEPGDNIWHQGVTCAEMDDALPHFNPCGTAGGCCFEGCPPGFGGGTHGCLPHREDICDRGYRIGRAILQSQVFGAPAWGTREEGCAYRQPLNNNCLEPVPTRYTGDNTLCQCSFTISPFIADELLAVGFDSCVLLPQDPRSWEEGCGDITVPLDEFPCRTLGMPLIIDDDGFAAFDFGNRYISPDPDVCVDVVADLYIDSEGFARSLACREFDDEGRATEIAIGSLHQEQCAAMYADYTWDQSRRC